MHSRFILERSVSTSAPHLNRDVAITAVVVLVFVEEVRFPSFPLKKFKVHSVEHCGKVLGVIAARTGKYGHHRAALIIFSLSGQGIL